MPIRKSSAAWTALILCLAGVGISIYLTYEHFTGSTTLACSDNGAVNCLKVTTSQWSVIVGVPVAVAGLAFYAAMTVLCFPVAFNRRTQPLRLAGCAAGIVFVLWLVYVELFKVDAICLWCTGVHVITLALLGVVLWLGEQLKTAPAPARVAAPAAR